MGLPPKGQADKLIHLGYQVGNMRTTSFPAQQIVRLVLTTRGCVGTAAWLCSHGLVATQGWSWQNVEGLRRVVSAHVLLFLDYR